MAKTTSFYGGVDTDWEVSGNWDNGIPADGDTVIVSRNSLRALSTNLDRTGEALDLAAFLVEDLHPFPVGSSGERLQLTADKVIVNHSNDFYFTSANGAGSEGTDLLVLNGGGYYDIIHQSDGLIAETDISGGVVTLDTSSGTFSVFIDPEQPVDVRMTGAAGTCSIFQRGGLLDYQMTTAAIVFFNLYGGECTVSNAYDIAGLYQAGGRFNYDVTGKTISETILLGGIFDATRTIGVKTASNIRRSRLVDYRTNADFMPLLTDRIIGE